MCTSIYVYIILAGVLISVATVLFHSLLAGFTILVRTGNSVDYSLAIRLLSLPWLSPLHHEIAWLSTGLECTSAKSPFFLQLSLSSPSGFMWLPSGQRSTHTFQARTHGPTGSWTRCTNAVTSFPVTIPLPPHFF